MTTTAEIKPTRIERADLSTPILFSNGRTDLGIKAGTVIEIDGVSHAFDVDTLLDLGDMLPGQDYGICLDADGKPVSALAHSNPLNGQWFAGFHFALGGCAEARSGGDTVPGINPHSIWDVGFRPTCADPRGMALIMDDDRRFWVDIYLLGVSHREHGTSRYPMEVADGRSLPLLDYATAVDIYASHRKRLLTHDEFRAAAFGVTERSSAKRDPGLIGLDASRTSRFGLMQATGNLWAWGTDGDPTDPRPSIFGGSWISGGNAGSRCANLDYWPESSYESISARGGSDHLNPA